jgi:type I restriction enzyme R subunit
MNEADTCQKQVVPLLQAAGWDDEPHSIAEQRTITDGRIVPVGKGFVRKSPKRVDYLLRYTRDFPLAVDTYLYFGSPIYEYSLRQGIDDGFLAPYRVHRVITEWDAAGWRPSKNGVDRYGRPIPDDEYQTKDFERIVALRARTQSIARHLTDFLKKTDRFAKTIVFCVDQEHASEMRAALSNLNSDLVARYPDYVCRVTADEGDIGRGHLGRFQDVDTQVPAILTTSQLLTTGVDVPTCKNVVLARVVGSMSEFKQIIGRGSRVRDDYGKLWFNIIDYTGRPSRLPTAGVTGRPTRRVSPATSCSPSSTRTRRSVLTARAGRACSPTCASSPAPTATTAAT